MDNNYGKEDLMSALLKLDNMIEIQRDQSNSPSPIRRSEQPHYKHTKQHGDVKNLARDISYMVGKIETPVQNCHQNKQIKRYDHDLLEKLLHSPKNGNNLTSKSFVEKSNRDNREIRKNYLKKDMIVIERGGQNVKEIENLKARPDINAASKEIALQKNSGIPIYKRYNQEIKIKENKLKELKKSHEVRKEHEEMSNCSPSFSKYKGERGQPSKSPQAISASVKSYLRLKDDRLRKATEQINHQKMKELTFKPTINKKSGSIIQNNWDRSVDNFAGSRLYRDASQREIKKEEARMDYIKQNCPFKPKLNNFNNTSVSRSQNLRSPSVSGVSRKSVSSNISKISNKSWLNNNTNNINKRQNQSKRNAKNINKNLQDEYENGDYKEYTQKLPNHNNFNNGGDATKKNIEEKQNAKVKATGKSTRCNKNNENNQHILDITDKNLSNVTSSNIFVSEAISDENFTLKQNQIYDIVDCKQSRQKNLHMRAASNQFGNRNVNLEERCFNDIGNYIPSNIENQQQLLVRERERLFQLEEQNNVQFTKEKKLNSQKQEYNNAQTYLEKNLKTLIDAYDRHEGLSTEIAKKEKLAVINKNNGGAKKRIGGVNNRDADKENRAVNGNNRSKSRLVNKSRVRKLNIDKENFVYANDKQECGNYSKDSKLSSDMSTQMSSNQIVSNTYKPSLNSLLVKLNKAFKQLDFRKYACIYAAGVSFVDNYC